MQATIAVMKTKALKLLQAPTRIVTNGILPSRL